jgi:carboxylesterase type B
MVHSLNFFLFFVSADQTGASHLDDIFYLFTSTYSDLPAIESNEFDLVKVMINLWTSFATFGTPACLDSGILWNETLKSDDGPKLLNITTKVEQISMIKQPE